MAKKRANRGGIKSEKLTLLYGLIMLVLSVNIAPYQPSMGVLALSLLFASMLLERLRLSGIPRRKRVRAVARRR